MLKKKKTQVTQRTARPETGRASVFSYHANRSRPESSTEQRADSKLKSSSSDATVNKISRLHYIPGIMAGLIIAGAIGYALVIDVNKPKVVPLTQTTPTILRSTSDYEQGIGEIMSKSIWNRSKLTINTNELASQIKQQFSELGEVSINMPLIGKRPIVQIAPAKPALIIGSKSAGVVVGEDGTALMPLSELPNGQQYNDLIRIEDAVNTEVEMGRLILPKSTVKFITEAQEYFKQNNMTIEAVKLPAAANELHIQPKDTPYIIKFNLQNDLRQQIGSYLALKDHIKAKSKTQPSEYVDVRVEDRIFYK